MSFAEKDDERNTFGGGVSCSEVDHLYSSVERILQQFCEKKSTDKIIRDCSSFLLRHSLSTVNNNDQSNEGDYNGNDKLERSLLSLLEADPSLASRKYRLQNDNDDEDHPLIESPPSRPPSRNEDGFLLLHHLCVTVSSSYTCSIELLQKVFESYRCAVVNDPAIMSHLLIQRCRNNKLEGRLLDLVGMVGEQWPQAYEELQQRKQQQKQQHQRLPPPIVCGWNRLLDSGRVGTYVDVSSSSAGETSLFRAYPHLMQHLTSLAVDFRGIDHLNGELQSPSRENESVRSWCIQQMLEQLVTAKGIVSLHQIQVRYNRYDPDLQVQFRRRESEYTAVDTTTNGRDHNGRDEPEVCFVSCRRLDDFVDSILPFFCNYGERNRRFDQFPIAKLRVELSTRNLATSLESLVERMTSILASCCVSECILHGPSSSRSSDNPSTVPCHTVNRLFGMVAEHPTIQQLTLQSIPIHSEEDWVDLGNLAHLGNLETLALVRMKLGNAMVPPLVQLVQESDRLQELDVRGNRIVDAELLVEAVGGSRTLRVFGCELDRTPLLESLERCMEASNTTIVRVLTEPGQAHFPPRRRRQLEQQRLHREESQRRQRQQQLGGMDIDDSEIDAMTTKLLLRDRIEYLCELNRIGRAKLRETTLTKEEFIVDVLGSFETDDFFQNFWHFLYHGREEHHSRMISLLYGLLRENPVVWCK